MIIALLTQKQKDRGGYLVEEDMRQVAHELNVELSHIQGLVTFYPHFHTSPPPKVCVKICNDMSCHLRGSVARAQRLKDWADEQYGPDVDVSQVSCLGRCDRAPAALINDQLLVARTEVEVKQAVTQIIKSEQYPFDSDRDWLNQRKESWQIDLYGNQPRDYSILRNYVLHPDPQSIIESLERAGLLGMGGAGGRTYLKWQDVRQARGTNKSVICNGDESEPGTFKDRDLMLRVPHLIVEGMILAGLVVGAQRGFILVRHEYSEQAEALNSELQRARTIGALGRKLFHSSLTFDLEVVVSPGNYIVGEQTALVEALEGRRAEPRNRPPELMTNGYQNQPTLLNNVETFAWVPTIVAREDGRWYAQQGAQEKSSGLRMFSVSGDVAAPGVVEVPCGITLGDLIDKFAGGMLAGKQLLAVSLSGASGGLLPAKLPLAALGDEVAEELVAEGINELDVRTVALDLQFTRRLGIMLGGGIVIYGSGADVLKEALACSRFFRDQSCGKCVPCRIGSQKITQMGQRLADGQVTAEELPALCQNIVELSDVMQATSICGLGQVAANPLRSILAYFPERIEQAIVESKSIARGSGSSSEPIDSLDPTTTSGSIDASLPAGEECTQ